MSKLEDAFAFFVIGLIATFGLLGLAWLFTLLALAA